MLTLGIETSCDDTAAAIVTTDGLILANVVSSQDRIHARFGGIVPELASRRHIECISTIVDEALHTAQVSFADIEHIAATQGPGLIGSLLVGFSYGKTLAYTLNKPFTGVDHMHGHLVSAFLEKDTPEFPYIALIISGGTTSLFRVDGFSSVALIGRTRDDAAGEAFDKVARLLDLGYPGGPAVSQAAQAGNPHAFDFPRAWLEESSFDFSFSGLKTSVSHQCMYHQKYGRHLDTADICASFEDAVTEVLTEKAVRAATAHRIDSIVLGGGVAANQTLRKRLQVRCSERGLQLFLPSLALCTDNAAMIALAGNRLYKENQGSIWSEDVYSRSRLGQ